MLSPFADSLKRLLPARLLSVIRSLLRKHLIGISPRVEDFADPDATIKAIGALDFYWKRRIRIVVSCPDNQFIRRCDDAGSLSNGVITMHNGLKVGGLSYYGAGIMNLLMENKGVHEPQEERAFQDVLPWIAERSTMLELGAYWGFYSLWFAHSVNGARNFLVEPLPDNLEAGRLNFALNGKEATFENAFAGSSATLTSNSPPTISVDSFLAKHRIPKLAMLHSDVQGAELEMLYGALGSLKSCAIDFCFISTHSNKMHLDCLEFLRRYQYRILVDANLDQSYAEDGLIAASSPAANGPESLTVTLRR